MAGRHKPDKNLAANSGEQREKSGGKEVRGRPFAPGDTRINRTGRPKDFPEFREMAKEKGMELAFSTLLRELYGQNAVKAAELILAYAVGRPGQAIELTGKDGGPIEVSDAREQLAAKLVALIDEGTGSSSNSEP